MNKKGCQQVVALPLEESPPGWVLDPVLTDPEVDAVFDDWEAPLVAPPKWQMFGLIRVAGVPRRTELPSDAPEQVLLFDLGYQDPENPGRPSYGTRYDRALVTRDPVPANARVSATVGILAPVCSALADNHVLIRPWAGIMGRVQDVRHYYYLCLEYPDALVLYRREDDTWTELARREMWVALHRPYELALEMRGNQLQAYLDGERIFSVTDYAYPAGKAGYRATCTSYLAAGEVTATPEGLSQHEDAQAAEAMVLADLRSTLPKPTLDQVIDLRHLGTEMRLTLGNLSEPGKPPQMLIALPHGDEETRCVARTLAGETLWDMRLPGRLRTLLTAPHDDGHQDVVAMSGASDEIFKIDGRTGELLVRRPLPTLPGQEELIWMFMPRSPVNLSGGPQPREYLIREGHNDGHNVWALDDALNVLWHIDVPVKFGHDYSVGACDVNGDGKEEVLAGATLLAPDGSVIWAQEALNPLLACPSGGHVDALAIGFFGAPKDGPTVHLQSSSAGNIVLDALTGEILTVHPQGHTQGRHVGKFVRDEAGIQVLAGCRWGNYGLLSVYAADGRRLSTFQPDYVGQSGPACNWAGDGVELAVIATDPRRAGAYDWLGRRLLDLRSFLPKDVGLYHGSTVVCQDILGDPRDEIILAHGGVVHILTQEKPLPSGTRVYAPTRRWRISYPGWTEVD